MSKLRNKIIRLAHANPELRDDLLPLLKEATDDGGVFQKWLDNYSDPKADPSKQFGVFYGSRPPNWGAHTIDMFMGLKGKNKDIGILVTLLAKAGNNRWGWDKMYANVLAAGFSSSSQKYLEDYLWKASGQR